MSLSEQMYGPHVLVCVRARGAFQKKKKITITILGQSRMACSPSKLVGYRYYSDTED